MVSYFIIVECLVSDTESLLLRVIRCSSMGLVWKSSMQAHKGYFVFVLFIVNKCLPLYICRLLSTKKKEQTSIWYMQKCQCMSD